jgi:hypothetical protein
MSQATIAPPEIKTLADLRRRLDRIWFHPAPGTAAEKDVVEAEVRENRLCVLVDGTLLSGERKQARNSLNEGLPPDVDRVIIFVPMPCGNGHRIGG